MLMIKLTTHCMKNFEHASRSIPQYKTIPGRRKAQPRKWGKCWCFNAVTQIAIPHWIDDDQNGDDDDDDDDDDFRDLGEIWELRGNCRCVSKPRQPRYSKIIIRIIIFIRIIRIIIFIISVSSLSLSSLSTLLFKDNHHYHTPRPPSSYFERVFQRRCYDNSANMGSPRSSCHSARSDIIINLVIQR